MTRGRTAPHRVLALVVGIERYAAGDGWNLPGPVRDALRFRDWLLARGVPETNILLHLAPLDGEDPGVPFRPADHNSLRSAFVTGIPARSGDALWVWWGGHGVLDRDERLRLYCADATVTDRRNIDVESARDTLRSDTLTGFARQTWMVDACQTFDERHNFPHSLPDERLPAGQRVQAHEQVLMFAATRGQRAANDPERRTGVFSDIVLRELPADPVPDPDALFEAVRGRLDVLRAAGGTDQLPTLHLHRPGRTEASVSPRGPAEARATGARSTARLVEALLAYPLMNDREERQALVRELPAVVVGRMPRHSMPRTDVIGIVRTLGAHPDRLGELFDAVTLFDVDPERAAELQEAIQELIASQRAGK
ncbi:caspase family protein [Streptomyces sp. NBC_00654]|uniref:effector-associated domain 2-containing protein n=1 Tax=Streptomyces sp. NBC_00654 TaxID=2975799 RepID=UPI00224E6160|nr:caspase family protein [Streptomyces sp. NBC_00654]MCX4965891.1 caspase family protein [Streptomyces sp. NBC_00654]